MIQASSGCLRLPKPDPANITVLTRNLPNKPILPWSNFDSPWLDSEVQDQQEQDQDDQILAESEPTTNDEE